MHFDGKRFTRLLFSFALLGALILPPLVRAAEEDEEFEQEQAPSEVAPAGTLAEAQSITADATAIVNFEELASRPQVLNPDTALLRPWMPIEYDHPAEPLMGPPSESGQQNSRTPILPFVASPSPTTSYAGLDDIAMVDSLYIIIPPDVSGGVGPTKVMEALNNNYRIRDKATGVTQSTVGTATFWAPVVAVAERASLTDPRVLYDPYNNRWITVMQTFTTGAGKLLVGVSQTSDPSGAWNLYNFNTAVTIDFPTVGFNKNWISIAVNRYSNAGVFQRGINLVVDYPQARAGVGSGTLFTQTSNTHFCTAPCATYSATNDTLFCMLHLSSTSGTYELDRITGTPAAPVYTSGGTLTRAGGGWTQPSGNQLPQSAPNSGASACGATPCKMESQDSQVRCAPVYRNGAIYYTQTIGLPSGTLTRTAVQWTKINSTGGAILDTGRIDDPTATATNGGKWYAYPHIAVNSVGDFIVGYTQFSSAQHPSAGYSIHLSTDGAGTTRDPLVYKAGDDYYHKTFSTATGRNRWGDFSTAQVDPSDDLKLWTLQEYAKTRTGTDDGNTGSNSSRWATWWAGVVTANTITASAGAGGSISPSGAVGVTQGSNKTFTITASPCFHIADVLVDGVSQGAIGTYTFLNVTADHTISASFAANTFTITASAGTGGSISPNGATVVNCGANQAYTITAAPCFAIADVVVDGVSQGAIGSYTFTNVTANHTLSATFTALSYTITASAGTGGTISPGGAVSVACGANQAFSITADPCYTIADVVVDGVSQGAVGTYTFTNVTANHTISASFTAVSYTITASAGAGGTISPSGAVSVACGADQTFTITPGTCSTILDVVVDGSSVGAVGTYTFTNVHANHTIDATFAGATYTITASAGSGGSISPAGATTVGCGGNATFTIEAADKCHGILDVLVDGVSVGAVTTYTFTDVQANHTIDASFSTGGPFTITASAGTGGTISPNGAVSVACGADQAFTITAAVGYGILDVVVDGNSVGAVGNFTFTDVQANHTIVASFKDIECPAVSVVVPNGGESLIIGVPTNLTWTATDNVGVTCVDLLLSYTGAGGPYSALATCIPNSGTYVWTVAGPQTTNAVLKVVGHDAAGNACEDLSDNEFTIMNFVVPVLLSQFQANAVVDGIELRWGMADNATFTRTGIERGDAASGPFTPLAGTIRTESGQSVLLDRDVVDGRTYYYRISGVTRFGQTVNFEPLAAIAGRPVTAFTLPAVQPNPTHGTAQFAFTVPRESRVKLTVYDVQGRAIATVVDGVYAAGHYQATWSGAGESGPAPSGIYFVHLEAPGQKLVQRFVKVH